MEGQVHSGLKLGHDLYAGMLQDKLVSKCEQLVCGVNVQAMSGIS